MKRLLFTLLFLPMLATANNNQPQPSGGDIVNTNTVSGTNTNTNTNTNTIGDTLSSSSSTIGDTMSNASAMVGDSTSSAIAGDSAATSTIGNVTTGPSVSDAVADADATSDSDASATTGDVSLTHNNHQIRQAPSVGLVTPPSTAECIRAVGMGGSDEKGSAVIGWSWLQRDCMALKQFELLSSRGLYGPAAIAYCARPIFRQPFEDQTDCEAQMEGSFAPAERKIIHIRVDETPQEICEEKVYGDTVIREYIDDDITIAYECQELIGKGS